VANKLIYAVGKDPVAASQDDWLNATSQAVRDQLVERWMMTTRANYAQDLKRVYYLSMEFLIGRTFTNALLAVDLYDTVREALADFGVDMSMRWPSASPMRRWATAAWAGSRPAFSIRWPRSACRGMGYGIRYEYGMFRQRIVDGQQVETPDYWLTRGNPWEFQRPEVNYRVRFGGHVQKREGQERALWRGRLGRHARRAGRGLRHHHSRATARRPPTRCGCGRRAPPKKSTSRPSTAATTWARWRARTSRRTCRACSTPTTPRPRAASCGCTRNIFSAAPACRTCCAATCATTRPSTQLSEKVSIHLNDTHPVLAVPELMRLLFDEHGLAWDEAWAHTQKVFSYTNHTLMHEALETWPVEMLGRILPRHLQIIYDMNAKFLATVTQKVGNDVELMRRLSLVDENGRAARAHGLRGGAGEPLDQRRVGAALGADEAVDLCRLRQDLSRAFQQQDQRRHAAPLARAGQPAAGRRCSTSASARAGGATSIAAGGAQADDGAAGLRARLPPCQAREQAAAGQLGRSST
jgi:starch phosphorylase